MKDNKEILSEAFFKKASYTDKLKKKLPMYDPQDAKTVGTPGMTNTLAVSDPDELKRRLVGSFGAIVGNNTIKTMANRAIKTFPIIISDNVDPETAVLIKRTTEEQYAQYVELLISNQIIDASEFVGNDDPGNVAIQALDRISGADFSKRQGFATRTADGKLDLNQIARNDLLFNLLRQEDEEFVLDDEFTKSLLEDAIILPADKSDLAVSFIAENLEDILTEAEGPENSEKTNVTFKYNPTEDSPSKYGFAHAFPRIADEEKEAVANKEYISIGNYFADKFATDNNKMPSRSMSKDMAETGNTATEQFFADSYVDRNKMDKNMSKTVGDILSKQPALKDRFEKATILLMSYRIAGHEYLSYLTERLGIPVPQKVRIEILTKYKSTDVVSSDNNTISRIAAKKISKGKTLENIKAIRKNILNTKLKVAFEGAAVAGGAGLTGGAIALATGASIFTTPFLLAVAIPALVGGSAYLIARSAYLKKHKRKMPNVSVSTSVAGWERVEALINQLDQSHRSLNKDWTEKENLDAASKNIFDSSIEDSIGDYCSAMKLDQKKLFAPSVLKEEESIEGDIISELKIVDSYESVPEFHQEINESNERYYFGYSKELAAQFLAESAIIHKELMKTDNEYRAQINEAIISTTFKPKEIKSFELDTKKVSSMVVPEYSLKNQKAYGSVEYDQRQIKDRRYNQPLIMKINFRERYSDGSVSDNEMSAVIGILGVVTRIPSEEMEEILKQNSQGITIKSILKPEGEEKTSIVDLFGLAKRPNKEMKSLEIWNNLEKISKLAIVNKLAGRQNNNIANAHIIFSQKEVDNVRNETGVDYLKDKKLVAQLMKKYSAFTIMIANDIGERLYIFDDLDAISWNIVPYSAFRTKDTGDQLTSALMKLSDRR